MKGGKLVEGDKWVEGGKWVEVSKWVDSCTWVESSKCVGGWENNEMVNGCGVEGLSGWG